MAEVLAITVAVLTAATLAATLIGLATRFILLPWLRVNLVEKVDETHHQVTVNAHASPEPEPTVLDKLDTLSAQVTSNRIDVLTLAAVLDNHIAHTREREEEEDDKP